MSNLISKEKMLQLVQGQLDAYNKRDIEAFCRFFHPEITTEKLLSQRSIHGMTDYKNMYKNLFESSPNLHCELKNRVVLESTILDEEWVTGLPKFPQGIHVVAIYAFRDNLIDRVWFPN